MCVRISHAFRIWNTFWVNPKVSSQFFLFLVNEHSWNLWNHLDEKRNYHLYFSSFHLSFVFATNILFKGWFHLFWFSKYLLYNNFVIAVIKLTKIINFYLAWFFYHNLRFTALKSLLFNLFIGDYLSLYPPSTP